MSIRSLAQPCELASSGPAIYPDDIQPVLQDTLAVLADIDAHFDGERERLEAWPGPDGVKRRLAAELAEAHRHEREPHVQVLVDLQRRWMALTRSGRYSLQ